MYRLIGLGLGLAGSASVVVPAIAREPLHLAPSSKWVVNYADDSCRLARSFGADNKRVDLILDRFRPGRQVAPTLVGQPIAIRGDVRTVIFRFGSDGGGQKREFEVGRMQNGDPAMIVTGRLHVSGPTEAEERVEDGDEDAGEPEPFGSDLASNNAVTFVDIRIPGKQIVRLDTGPMGAPMKALADCTSDLLRGWGIDVDAHQSLSRRAVPATKVGKWLSSSDYPVAMLIRGRQALVHFRLIVDEIGKPKSCHIQQSTRPQAFDDAVCRGIMAKAQFKPALDATGKPIMSYYVNRVRFTL
ncbi:MAG: energy transducer TonB [Sphingopyxis sp.]|uniref:energy transducer TonB n=1 Tax=Sphingopyxis sp. TaxID=1908224 RepID=UPI002AB91D9B|nr:energy transducer TonB [Sphingopyxis sp.]MDZ3830504.1 energy transducer TonB [Sphingopyxis sp.]